MATYNKRGYKSKAKKEKEVIEEPEVQSEEMDSTTAELFNSLDEGASKTEEWVENNKNTVLGVIGVIVVAAIGFFVYTKFIGTPKEEKASNDMFFAQEYFNEAMNGAEAKDSLLDLSLKGGNGTYGFLDIIEEYNGTKAANLATYSAGMAYLELKNYDKAIEYLDNFNADDEMLAPLAKGNIGDAFSQLGQYDDAMSYYDKAIALKDNDFTTPLYLFKAGMLAKEQKDYDKALKYFNRIKEEYPESQQAKTIDAYIALVENIK
ncbi:Tetratricopeptide repeat-containing protein [Pustulibacterium marinum]|uniref:Tetratricopeptide repeat-containing protein n=1 Tax=Pustulibacterium marinum TaxID=1224947 RepID=A0A1I7H5M3_9FLAO|nr:tetratricopeptide repeat protein [Pustulibacterium marinum]SFU55983.1 Tetratricopeptide repeat-containing protein [Pustulibacterium marinum]